MTVRLFSTFRAAAGKERVHVDVAEGATVADILEQVEDATGLRAVVGGREYQWRHGSTSFLVVVNGRNVEKECWGSERLSPGDEVWLQPPVAGG